ncbi:thiamine phosphate synthase [Bacillus sp. FJAT-50079]|uniref:thiamine phosphate synthase n=1 Tax=Bacillus sp. FJAT-50079 TaxID=2833577 RepID=UPI001BC8F935|nr:thiamine phosphate synthase [Bacillus sp. FJAT-50079]MBS4208712.1 thiamine phosphate synthase [Bacillus sp. FJAT-50079]
MGSENTENPLNVLEQALLGGVTCFQFREKGSQARQGFEKHFFAKSCQLLCKHYEIPFIVNDDVELAIELDADGVHIGQDDESALSVRKKIGNDKLLGVSVHSIQEAIEAKDAGADYVGIGPVYPTISKADAKPVAGTSVIEEVSAYFPNLPIVGIGGITPENSLPVFQAGAAGIAVISAIAAANNPKEAARRFIAAVNKERKLMKQ